MYPNSFFFFDNWLEFRETIILDPISMVSVLINFFMGSETTEEGTQSKA